MSSNIIEDNSLFELLDECDPYLRVMIIKMLEFNPHIRWSAKKCLKSPYFDDVRSLKS